MKEISEREERRHKRRGRQRSRNRHKQRERLAVQKGEKRKAEWQKGVWIDLRALTSQEYPSLMCFVTLHPIEPAASPHIGLRHSEYGAIKRQAGSHANGAE